MSMVDENDPFKGLETTKQRRKRTHYVIWFLNNMLFITVAIITVIYGFQERYEEMRFSILVLFFMLVIDYVRDILKEVKALRRAAEKGQRKL